MGQVTIYLDAETERLMTEQAKALGLSKSKWIARAIHRNLAGDWPSSVREMPGSWSDFPSAEELRTGLSDDVEREAF